LIVGHRSVLGEFEQFVNAQTEGGGDGGNEREARICALPLFDLRQCLGRDLSGKGQLGPRQAALKAPLPQYGSHCTS
jgi:hypothetical protein